MAGLNDIITTIEQDGDKEAQETIANAQKKASAILAAAKEEAQQILAAGEKAALAKCQRETQSARSGAQAKAGRAMLQAKVEAVQSVTDAALKQLHTLPHEDYFAVLQQLIVLNADRENGELLLNAVDQQRMPADFLAKVNTALKPKGASVVLANENADIADGVILRYGEIEENCSFTALLEAKSSDVKDLIASILFAGGENK